ncbi:MAG: hypothetical protein ACMVP2_26050 [Imperialibacter sp.]|uniref:hypothetical protein n=1 Tax=Imperialibacter sp. TaxID=2038411 RepID=UPI003A85497D
MATIEQGSQNQKLERWINNYYTTMSNKKMQKEEPSGSIWMMLLGPELLGFIGGIIGKLINWKKDNQLAISNLYFFDPNYSIYIFQFFK